jgi:hypothetical protein
MSHNGILRIKAASVCGPFRLHVTFSDGVSKKVNVRPLLRGPVMTPLTDESYFAKVRLDRLSGTVTWPNGADFAPEALYDLPPLDE